MSEKTFYIVKKCMDGIYLLDGRNKLLLQTQDENTAVNSYKNLKSTNDKLVLFTKDDGNSRFLTVLRDY